MVKFSLRAISPFLNPKARSFSYTSTLIMVNGIVEKLALKTTKSLTKALVLITPKYKLSYLSAVIPKSAAISCSHLGPHMFHSLFVNLARNVL